MRPFGTTTPDFLTKDVDLSCLECAPVNPYTRPQPIPLKGFPYKQKKNSKTKRVATKRRG